MDDDNLRKTAHTAENNERSARRSLDVRCRDGSQSLGRRCSAAMQTLGFSPYGLSKSHGGQPAVCGAGRCPAHTEPRFPAGMCRRLRTALRPFQRRLCRSAAASEALSTRGSRAVRVHPRVLSSSRAFRGASPPQRVQGAAREAGQGSTASRLCFSPHSSLRPRPITRKGTERCGRCSPGAPGPAGSRCRSRSRSRRCGRRCRSGSRGAAQARRGGGRRREERVAMAAKRKAEALIPAEESDQLLIRPL